MSANKHSPLPWKKDRYGNFTDATGRRIVLTGVCIASGYTPSDSPAYADADMVFRAVNSHAQLVAALNNLVNTVRDAHRDAFKIGEWAVVAEARAALAAAKGDA